MRVSAGARVALASWPLLLHPFGMAAEVVNLAERRGRRARARAWRAVALFLAAAFIAGRVK